MGRRGAQVALGLVVFAVLAVGAGYVFWPAPVSQPVAPHYASHSQKDFYPTLQSGEPVPAAPERVYGGIVSHHLYAEADIAKFFLALQGQKPSVVVIIGPNHFNAGNHDILLSRAAYETPWGRLENDQRLGNRLIQKAKAFNEEAPFEHEHSISALVTFVKFAFPETRLVPVIVKRTTSPEDMERLARALDDQLPDDALVLASVDFSHHGNRFMAQFHDDKSVPTIASFDMENISKLEIDSPPSITALLEYLRLRGAQRMAHVNTNSAKIGFNPTSDDVTSYLFAHFFKGTARPTPTISTLHFGDIMLGREVAESIAGGLAPFEKIQGREGNFLRGIDWIAANLEGPITDANDCPAGGIRFKFPISTGKLLRGNNIGIVNIVNNHAQDCGPAGAADTKRYLAASGVGFFGGSEVLTKIVAEKTIAFVGADPAAVADAKKNHDFVIVHAHWGTEYQNVPNTQQRELGHALIDAGADVVIGHHPHVVEPVEIYHGRPIFYSLGNFVFDQTGPGTNEGTGVGVIQQDQRMRFYIYPFDIIRYQPTLKPYAAMLKACDFVLKDIPDRDGCFFELPRLR